MPADFQIKVRNLETDETLIATLEKYEDALTWLSDRPHLMEVITVLSDVSPKQLSELRAAMRPYDDEEKKALAARQQQIIDAIKRAREEDEARAQEEQERARAEAASGDPNRPLKIRWSLEEGCVVNDPFDARNITPEAEAAVLDWVKERNGWVADRGQIVGEAELEVYPAALPEGADARVMRGGRFTPRMRENEA